jgi:hypothetical protein
MKSLIVLFVISLQSAFAGLYTSEYLWPRNEVVVCFAQGEEDPREVEDEYDVFKMKIRDWNKRDMKKVEKWVNEEFTNEMTGINFIGWKMCAETPEAEVILFYNKNFPSHRFFSGRLMGTTGSAGAFKISISGYPAAVNFTAIGRSGMDKTTTIHEFGHIAGLGHEHNHPQAEKTGSCKYNDPYNSQFFTASEYDPESIMSYCTTRSSLSVKDSALLKKLYP